MDTKSGLLRRTREQLLHVFCLKPMRYSMQRTNRPRGSIRHPKTRILRPLAPTSMRETPSAAPYYSLQVIHEKNWVNHHFSRSYFGSCWWSTECVHRCGCKKVCARFPLQIRWHFHLDLSLLCGFESDADFSFRATWHYRSNSTTWPSAVRNYDHHDSNPDVKPKPTRGPQRSTRAIYFRVLSL